MEKEYYIGIDELNKPGLELIKDDDSVDILKMLEDKNSPLNTSRMGF
ncbi:MAG: hypothetical protein HC906_11470 [Bacteroidales bacterium]|nr:hypothetical protein [Bacteroidales bacterium]